MAFKNITNAQKESFISALRAGQYNLLLGAGTSMDSQNHLGCLPSSSIFKNELCALKDISEKYSLQQVYSLLEPSEVDQYVTRRFSGAKPGPTAKLISSFIWKRIFCWNVDEVLEKAYEYKEARQNLVPLHFSDNFI